MKARHQRLLWIALGLGVLAAVVALVLNAFSSNLVFFYTPTQVAKGEAPSAQAGRSFRVGGLVADGSLQRDNTNLQHEFVITDTVQNIKVRYKGLLPDLFQQGKGVVAQGKLGADGVFVASEVLAKHDENYMPPEAAAALNAAKSAAQADKPEGAASKTTSSTTSGTHTNTYPARKTP